MPPGRRRLAALVLAAAGLSLSGCYSLRGPRGGGMSPAFSGPRRLTPTDIALPPGFVAEKVLGGLTYPTAVLFDDDGRVYVIESGYSYGESWARPRLLRVEPEGGYTVVAQGNRNGPWTGGVYHKGFFYVAEGGELEGGRILRIDPDGRKDIMLAGLPSTGDYQTTGPVIGPDGMLYFGQGTVTNAGVVGDDNARAGWLDRYPAAHDIPCADVTLAGLNFKTQAGETGAFQPYGKPSRPGEVVEGAVPCSGAIMRLPLSGGKPELVAWGLRDPFGLAFSPGGKLYAVDEGYEERGSRPVWGAADFLWTVSTGAWYGWPDYSGQLKLGLRFRAPGKPAPQPVLAREPGRPPAPTAILGSHSGSRGLDFSRTAQFGYVGDAFIAQFGDLAPASGKVLAPVGYKVVRVSPESGAVEDFAVNKGRINGPASLLGTGGLERPVAARFDRSGADLYVVDFGVVRMTKDGPVPYKNTGALWVIHRRD